MNESVTSISSQPIGLFVSEDRVADLKREAIGLRSIDLTDHQVCDLSLLLSGACQPLTGYMNREDYESVLTTARLASGEFFPLPVALGVETGVAESLAKGERLVLRDDEGAMLAVLTVGDVWAPCGKESTEDAVAGLRPDADRLLGETSMAPFLVGGRLEGVGLPAQHDYPEFRVSATKLWRDLRHAGNDHVVVVDPSTEIAPEFHRAIAAFAQSADGIVILQPAVGALRSTDLALHRKIKQYRGLLSHYPGGRARLCLMPLASRGAGERALLWRAMINRNIGATHFCVDPQDYGLGEGAAGSAAVLKIAAQHQASLGIELIPLREFQIGSEQNGAVVQAGPVQKSSNSRDALGAWEAGARRLTFQGAGSTGVTCFFTGLSGAGKSTIARALAAEMSKLGRMVTLLDGDLIRRHLSSELTFSKEHRDLNIRRIGYVASEITRHGGVAICAPIAPYRVTRNAVRTMVEAGGHFLEIHVATSLSVCSQRDPKGLYAKAYAGLIKDFTGVSDPYEAPESPEIYIDTAETSVEGAVSLILGELISRGCLNTFDHEELKGLSMSA